MRRRDVIFACVAWAGFLAALSWALLTQFRWVRENKPIQVKRPLDEIAAPAPIPASTIWVIGTIGDDTRAAMAKDGARRKPTRVEPVPPTRPRSPSPGKAPAPPG